MKSMKNDTLLGAGLISKINLIHVLLFWTFLFFISQVAFAESNSNVLLLESPIPKASSVGAEGAFPDIEVILQTYKTPEEFLASRQAKNIAATDENLLTFVNPDQSPEIVKKWGRVLKKGMHYLVYPAVALKKHFSNQVNYYKSDKMTLVVLTAHAGASAINWFMFADDVTIQQQSYLVAMNAVLYAYLTVNVPNWQKILKGSEIAVERYRKFRNTPSGANDALFANMSVNFGFFLINNILVQGILNLEDLSRLVSGDLISFMLTNSVLGVASSGVWDTSFRKWFMNGKISEKTLTHLNWGESLVSTIITSFIAMGYDAGYIAVAAHGVAGASSLILTSNNKVTRGLKIAKNKLKWAYQRSRIKLTEFIQDEGSVGSGSTQGMPTNACYQFIR